MVKILNFLLLLFVFYPPLYGQSMLKLRVSLDSSRNYINLTFLNMGENSFYLPYTFQNYHFGKRLIGHLDNIKKSPIPSGSIIEIEPIKGVTVLLRSFFNKGDYRRKLKVEKTSTYSRLNLSLANNMYLPQVRFSGVKLVNRINKKGMCIPPQDSVVAKIKINRHFFYRKNYYFGDSLKSSSYVLMRVGYRNIVPRNYLQDSTIRYCDSLFTGLIYSENVLKINLK